QRFATQSKAIGAVISLLLVLALPLDALELLKRLSVNDKFRNELVTMANDRTKSAPDKKPTEADLSQAKEDLKLLQSPTLQITSAPIVTATVSPLTFTRTTEPLRRHIPGFLLAWVLLSLGTPFWYDALKNLVKFRSTLARKDDQDRKDRQADSQKLPTNSPEP